MVVSNLIVSKDVFETQSTCLENTVVESKREEAMCAWIQRNETN